MPLPPHPSPKASKPCPMLFSRHHPHTTSPTASTSCASTGAAPTQNINRVATNRYSLLVIAMMVFSHFTRSGFPSERGLRQDGLSSTLSCKSRATALSSFIRHVATTNLAASEAAPPRCHRRIGRRLAPVGRRMVVRTRGIDPRHARPCRSTLLGFHGRLRGGLHAYPPETACMKRIVSPSATGVSHPPRPPPRESALSSSSAPLSQRVLVPL